MCKSLLLRATSGRPRDASGPSDPGRERNNQKRVSVSTDGTAGAGTDVKFNFLAEVTVQFVFPGEDGLDLDHRYGMFHAVGITSIVHEGHFASLRSAVC